MHDLKLTVETLGAFFETTGLTPIEARVFALLLLAEPRELDFFAIQKALQASKGAISNSLKRLGELKRVEYVTHPGDRKRYFRVNTGEWLAEMQTRIASVAPFVNVIQRVLDYRKRDTDPAFYAEMERVQSFFRFLADRFPQLIAEWERENPTPST